MADFKAGELKSAGSHSKIDEQQTPPRSQSVIAAINLNKNLSAKFANPLAEISFDDLMLDVEVFSSKFIKYETTQAAPSWFKRHVLFKKSAKLTPLYDVDPTILGSEKTRMA